MMNKNSTTMRLGLGEKKAPSLSIIIPAYNEEKRIGESLKKILEYLDAREESCEILIVDDGCRDNTLSIVREVLGSRNYRILINEKNMGKGASIRRGMLAAKGDMCLFTDADLSTPIEELDKLSEPLKGDFDVVFGSRAMKESQLIVRQPFHREMMGRTFNLLVQLLHLPGVKDSQCGFKLFTRKAAQAVFKRQKMQGFCFDVEVLVLARKLGFKIKEVPVKWIDSPQSKVNPIKDAMKMFWDLVKLKFLI